MKKLFRWLDLYLEEAMLVVLLVAITFVMTLQIIMRYVFNYSLIWPEEFNRLCFVVSAFISLGYAIRRKRMLRVDVVISLVPQRVGQVVEYIGKAVSLVFYAYLFYNSFEVVTTSYTQQAATPALEFPLYLVYASVTVGFGLAIIRSVQELASDIWSARKSGEEVKV